MISPIFPNNSRFPILFAKCLLKLKRLVSFFFNDTATTEIYTLSLHDALPISQTTATKNKFKETPLLELCNKHEPPSNPRSEEHTSELQSRLHLVCRLLLEKKKKT